MRFYVFILETLPEGHKVCQGGHAVAQYLQNKETEWLNGNMICLDASEAQLNELACNPESVSFHEEDFGNKLTAVAIVTDNKKEFQHFNLVGCERA